MYGAQQTYLESNQEAELVDIIKSRICVSTSSSTSAVATSTTWELCIIKKKSEEKSSERFRCSHLQRIIFETVFWRFIFENDFGVILTYGKGS